MASQCSSYRTHTTCARSSANSQLRSMQLWGERQSARYNGGLHLAQPPCKTPQRLPRDLHLQPTMTVEKPVNVTVPGLSLLARLSPRQELAPSPRLPNNSLSSPPPRARSRPKRTVGDWAMLMPPWLRGGMVVSTIEITDGLKTSSTHPPPVLDVHNSALPSTSLDLCPKTCAPKILDLLRCLKM